MKTSMKKWVAGVTMATVLGFSVAPAYAAVEVGSTDLTLVVNGKFVTTNEEIGQPFITKDGHTMVPLRLVTEELGYGVMWSNDGSLLISGAEGFVNVELQIGDTAYTANGVSGHFSRPVETFNDRTYLPARDFTELYGDIVWDNETRTVSVTMEPKLPVEEVKDWTFDIDYGNTEETADKQYVVATNKETGEKVLLTGAEKEYGILFDPMPDIYYYVGGSKVINDRLYVTVGRGGAMGLNEVSIFEGPEVDKIAQGGELTCIGHAHNGADFTVANGYLYYTDGLKSGPWTTNPHALYFTKIGAESGDVVTFDLDFSVNACVLTVEDGVLVATEKDGTRHEILNVPEADSVDVAHMKEILEAGTTLEGFLETGFLTAAEISCLPGAVTSSEFGSLQ
ncbi:MAG: stalk domain-containing protein [Peptococcaceae bacterium]|nr:stalk domain-containing protein [Peptococcaceae bacterium]